MAQSVPAQSVPAQSVPAQSVPEYSAILDAAGHQNFFAYPVRVFDYAHTPPTLASGQCTHQAGGTATDHHHVNWIVHRPGR